MAKRSVRGGAVTTAAQASKLLLNVLATAVLARILTPEDFGIVGMVTAVTAFVMVFREVGLSTATIQSRSITQEQLTGLFWINGAVGLALGLVVAALGPALAHFYVEPRVTLVTLLISPVFLLHGLACQHQALLKRELKFSRLAVVDVTSMAAGALAGVAAAWLGARHLALAVQQLTFAACACVLAWRLHPWRPGRPGAMRNLRDLLRYGLHVVGFDVANYFSRNLDNLLVGRFWGAEALGFYAKAYQLFLVPVAQIRGPLVLVALPSLSALQGDKERYVRYYRSFLFALAALSMPLTALLFVFADEIVLLALGPQWGAAVTIFRILAVGGLIQGVETTRGLVMLSSGHSRTYFRFGMVRAAYTSLAFLAGLPWGPVGVASAYVLVDYLALFPSLWYSFRETPVRVKDFVAAIAPALAGSLVMGATMWGVGEILPRSIWSYGASVLCGALAFGGTLVLLPGGRRGVRTLRAAIGVRGSTEGPAA